MDYLNIASCVPVVQNPRHVPKFLDSVPAEMALRPPQPVPDNNNLQLQETAIRDFKADDYDAFIAHRDRIQTAMEQAKLRQVAPGLSKDPLLPSYSQSPSASKSPVNQQQSMDFLEFEQGLPPPNPWDAPTDTLEELKSVFSSPASPVPAAVSQSPSKQQQAPLQMPQLPERYVKLPSNLSTPLSRVTPPPDLPARGSSPNQPSSATLRGGSALGQGKDVVSKIVAWGFPDAVVRRGVEIYGMAEENRVMNFCVNSQHFEKAGHSLQDYYDAVSLYGRGGSDDPRVQAYLTAFSRVKEVGFDAAMIKEALVKTEPKNGDFEKWSEEAVGALLQ